MNSDNSDHIELQRQLAQHLRDPQSTPPPAGVDTRRLAVYRRLMMNNIQAYLAQVFPILEATLCETQWQALCTGFIARHRCMTPQLYRLAEEFLDFLASDATPCPDPPPFLLELAHFEWVELDLAVAEDPEPLPVASDGDLLDGIPVLNPHLRSLCYRYPVHQINPDFKPATPADHPVFLAIYRHPQDQDIRWLELSPASARLIHEIQVQPQTNGNAILAQLQDALDDSPGPARDWRPHARQALLELQARGVILGHRRPD